jgi:long-chain acyl-CoA synthetase
MSIETLGDIAREHAVSRPDKVALTHVENAADQSHRSWTFAELDVESNRIANALLEEDIQPGMRIAYLDKNAPEYFLYLLGGAKVNAVSVAVNWRLAVPEMQYILNNSEAHVILSGSMASRTRIRTCPWRRRTSAISSTPREPRVCRRGWRSPTRISCTP